MYSNLQNGQVPWTIFHQQTPLPLRIFIRFLVILKNGVRASMVSRSLSGCVSVAKAFSISGGYIQQGGLLNTVITEELVMGSMVSLMDLLPCRVVQS